MKLLMWKSNVIMMVESGNQRVVTQLPIKQAAKYSFFVWRNFFFFTWKVENLFIK